MIYSQWGWETNLHLGAPTLQQHCDEIPMYKMCIQVWDSPENGCIWWHWRAFPMSFPSHDHQRYLGLDSKRVAWYMGQAPLMPAVGRSVWKWGKTMGYLKMGTMLCLEMELVLDIVYVVYNMV